MCVFVVHAAVFGSWLMDDAGISFAYARNLASGHGLVSQPGASPVEGYSNFLWVLVMAVFFRLGLFHIFWTPKIAAGILTAGSFLVVTDTLRRATAWGPAIAACALTLVALQPGFVIWSISGLENPLYVFLLCLLMAAAFELLVADSPSRTTIVFSGLLTGGIAATRPDGMIYLAVVPVIATARAWMTRSLRPSLDAIALYSAVTAVLLGSLLGFRWWYFHDVLPNTYYMKGAGHMGSMLLPDAIPKIRALAESVAGEGRAKALVIVVLGGTAFLLRRHFQPIHAVLALFAGLSWLSYVLLPQDFMGEYRFATPFFLFFYTYVAALAWSLCTNVSAPLAAKRLTFAIVIGLLVGVTLDQAAKRSEQFAAQPATSLALVAEYFGDRYNRLADALGLDSASLLTVNQGGALLASKLAVVDLGGLCDRTIARTIGRDQQAFYDYVFDEVRPTFIEVHTGWIRTADFDADPRFQRDYVAIKQRIVNENGMSRVESADYVRRDAVAGPVERLTSILGPDSPCCHPRRPVRSYWNYLGG